MVCEVYHGDSTDHGDSAYHGDTADHGDTSGFILKQNKFIEVHRSIHIDKFYGLCIWKHAYYIEY